MSKIYNLKKKKNVKENEKQRNKVTLPKFNHKNRNFDKKHTWKFEIVFHKDLAFFPGSFVVHR